MKASVRRLACGLLIAAIALGTGVSPAFAIMYPGSNCPREQGPRSWWDSGDQQGGTYEGESIALYPGQTLTVELTSRPKVKGGIRLMDGGSMGGYGYGWGIGWGWGPAPEPLAETTGACPLKLEYTYPATRKFEPRQLYLMLGSTVVSRGWQPPADFTVRYTISDPPLGADIKRFAGAGRYETALAVSSTFATASAVIVASGVNFPDALAASGLAGSYDCPILLTPPKSLLPSIPGEIARLGASKVFVVGGPAAVAESVVESLGGSPKVVRLGGVDRYETAAAIAAEVRAHEGAAYAKSVLVATGEDFPDALAASPIAFGQKMPIVLVRKDSVPAVTAAEIASGGVTEVHVLGSTTAVGGAYAQLAVAKKERIAGQDRFLTAMALAEHAVASGWAKWDEVGLATGDNYPDGLVGGAECGRRGGVMLLAHWYGLTAQVYDKMPFGALDRIRYYGGTDALLGTEMGDIQYQMALTRLLTDPKVW